MPYGDCSDDLAVFERRDVAHTWKWRDAGGNFHEPADMETRHLFYTLRMIWNHSMPAQMRVGRNVRLYSFSRFYTREYMRDAVYFIGRMLLKRTDLLPWQRNELAQMAAWMRSDLWEEIFYLSAPQQRIEKCA